MTITDLPFKPGDIVSSVVMTKIPQRIRDTDGSIIQHYEHTYRVYTGKLRSVHIIVLKADADAMEYVVEYAFELNETEDSLTPRIRTNNAFHTPEEATELLNSILADGEG